MPRWVNAPTLLLIYSVSMVLMSFSIMFLITNCRNSEIRDYGTRGLPVSPIGRASRSFVLCQSLVVVWLIGRLIEDISNEISNRYYELAYNPAEIISQIDLLVMNGCISIFQPSNKDEILQSVDGIVIDIEGEVAGYICYYKYKILLENHYPIDKNSIIDDLEKFRCLGGYRLNSQRDFFDPQITHLLVMLKSDLDK
ncbi:MAG: hypothetical protein FWF88_12480 [Peptococcaceae bacterium]|nr:hypothetical protein [Peptococcaceae bacterium]